MKNIIYIVIILFQISLSMGQSNIENELKLQLPQDLKKVWDDQQWTTSNNVFTFYNYTPFYLINPKDEIKIISQSKSLNKYLQSTQSIAKKSIVIAKSLLDDEGQYLFYGYDENGENLGVWLWRLDNGPQFPSKVSNNLTQIFESLEALSSGFDYSDTVTQLWIKASQKKLDSIDFGYGNFPTKDLKVIAEEICPDIIYFPNEITFLVEEDKLNEIDAFYENLGKKGLKSEMDDKHLTELLCKVNMEQFNIGKANKVFIIQFYNSQTYGLCNCNKAQAKALNKYGYLSFLNLEDSESFSNFTDE